MKLCDLHNDFLVELQTESERANYIKLINKNKNIKYICGAVYTTHLKNPIDYLNKIIAVNADSAKAVSDDFFA